MSQPGTPDSEASEAQVLNMAFPDSSAMLRGAHVACTQAKRAEARAGFQKHLAQGTYVDLDGSELPESDAALSWKSTLDKHKAAVHTIDAQLQHEQTLGHKRDAEYEALRARIAVEVAQHEEAAQELEAQQAVTRWTEEVYEAKERERAAAARLPAQALPTADVSQELERLQQAVKVRTAKLQELKAHNKVQDASVRA